MGDTEAFEALVRRHEVRIVALCGRMLGDAESARDAAQDVFLKAFRKAASFRPKARVGTWLYRIAVNHCLNRLRRRRIVRFLSYDAPRSSAEDAPLIGEPVDGAAGPARRLDARRRWRSVRASIDRLPPGQRVVVVLAKLEGLRYREIAELLGITEGAVESRLFRAMRRLTQEKEG